MDASKGVPSVSASPRTGRNQQLGLQEPASNSLLEQEETLMMASFGGISEARKRELDSICEPPRTEAEEREEEARWLEYFEEQAEGLSPEQKNVLWHRIMTSAFETDAGALPPFAPPVKPDGEEEERYMQWRREFNLRRQAERQAENAVQARCSAKGLAAEVADKQKTIQDLSLSLIEYITRFRREMNDKDFGLFLLLITRRECGTGVLKYSEIGKKLTRPITKQAVYARAQAFGKRHPSAWAFVQRIRIAPQTRAFSELSASEQRKAGIDKSYSHQR